MFPKATYLCLSLGKVCVCVCVCVHAHACTCSGEQAFAFWSCLKTLAQGPGMSFSESPPLPSTGRHCGRDRRTTGATEEPGLLPLCRYSPALRGSQNPRVTPWSAGLRGPGTASAAVRMGLPQVLSQWGPGLGPIWSGGPSPSSGGCGGIGFPAVGVKASDLLLSL